MITFLKTCSIFILFVTFYSCSRVTQPIAETMYSTSNSETYTSTSASGLTEVVQTTSAPDYYVSIENDIEVYVKEKHKPVTIIEKTITPETITASIEEENTTEPENPAQSANWALFWGILAIVIFPLGLVFGLIGITKSIKAIRQIKADPESFKGLGRARVALVLSSIGSFLGLIISVSALLLLMAWLNWISLPLPQA